MPGPGRVLAAVPPAARSRHRMSPAPERRCCALAKAARLCRSGAPQRGCACLAIHGHGRKPRLRVGGMCPNRRGRTTVPAQGCNTRAGKPGAARRRQWPTRARWGPHDRAAGAGWSRPRTRRCSGPHPRTRRGGRARARDTGAVAEGHAATRAGWGSPGLPGSRARAAMEAAHRGRRTAAVLRVRARSNGGRAAGLHRRRGCRARATPGPGTAPATWGPRAEAAPRRARPRAA